MTTSPLAEQDRRASYTAGLRQLADVLDAHPEVPLPYNGTGAPLSIMFVNADEPKAALADALRAFPGTKTKRVWTSGESGASYFDVDLTLAGLKVKLTAFRDQVCERVVTGTREVTKEIPDRAALAAVPTVTVTETVEDVEWVCSPLLATEPVSA